MRSSLLKPGYTVNWQPDKGDPTTTRRITFVERVLGNGLTKTQCFFKTKDLALISMSDYEVSRRVTN